MGARNRATAMVSRAAASLAPDYMGSKLRNPYFFIGCGRSGTTLLARLLATHKDIAVYPYEANELWHPRAYPWDRWYRNTLPIWVDPYKFTETSLRMRTDQDNKKMKAVFGAYQFIFGGRCFVNKSVLVTFMLPYILERFPDARFIHIVRDGRAVALSFAIKERRMIDASPEPYRKSGIDFPLEVLINKFAEHWKQHIMEIETQKANLGLEERGIMHELSYEDLCAHPREKLAGIARFMGLDPDRYSNNDYSYVKNTDYKYKQKLSPSTIRNISNIMQPALELKCYGG
jgi:hypothetical protein